MYVRKAAQQKEETNYTPSQCHSNKNTPASWDLWTKLRKASYCLYEFIFYLPLVYPAPVWVSKMGRGCRDFVFRRPLMYDTLRIKGNQESNALRHGLS